MAESPTLEYYDISSPLQPRSFSPNPSKSRYALSLKGVPFKTTWVDIPDIAKVRGSLKCTPTRKFDDGSNFFTLPMLRDPSSGGVIGDSFDIAEWLDENFPDVGGRLFPVETTRTGLDYESPSKDTMFYAPLTSDRGSKHEDYANFNVHVDATFSANIALYAFNMPFPPEKAEEIKKLMCKRAHLESWEQLNMPGEVRGPMKEAMRASLASLAEFFNVNGDGPYLEGKQVNYADMIVGGWLNMLSVIMPEAEWEDFGTWYGGVFGRLHDALQEKYFACT